MNALPPALEPARVSPVTHAPVRVLLVEDEPVSAALVGRILRDTPTGSFELIHRPTLRAALANSAEELFDVVLLDLNLPDSEGLATFEALRQKLPITPLVILTAAEDESLALQAIQGGAQDYLFKSQLDARMLVRVVRYAIERKRTEEALRERVEFFRLISENVSDLIAVIDADGRRIYNSPSYTALLGQPRQLTGSDSFQEVHPEDRDRIRQIFHQTMASGIGQTAEYRFVRPDGEVRFVESRGSVIRDAVGRPAQVVVVSRDITERRRAEDELREREEFFRLISENVTDMIAVLDRHGRRLYNSRSYRHIFGDPQAMRGTNSFAEIHAEDRDKIRKVFEETIQSGVGQRAEFRFVLPTGEVRNVESIGTVIRDAQGQAAKLVVVSRDITDRKQAEGALRQSEQRYRRLLRSTTDYIFTVKVENGVATSTIHGQGCEAVTGYTPEDYAADPHLWYRMIHPSDRDAVVARAHQVLTGEQVPPLEHRLIHKDGSVRWVKHTAVGQKDALGRLLSYDGLVSDITERRQAEEERERFFTLALDMLCIAGMDGYFRQINPAWTQTLGWRKEELLGKPYIDFVHPDDRERTLAEAARMLPGVNSRLFENRYRCRDGSYRWLVWNACPFPEQKLIYAAAHDITERKQYEARLQAANAELSASEESLRQALEDLRRSHAELQATQLNLIQAEKMESVGTLAAGVAHEVKNPLQVLLMGLRYLSTQSRGADQNVRQTIEDMRTAVSRADGIVRSLLEFSSSHHLDMRPASLHAIIEQSLQLARYELEHCRVQVQLDLAPQLPLLRLDKIKMEQVFINILINAVHAMPGGGSLTVRTALRRLRDLPLSPQARQKAPFHLDLETVVAEVEDTGEGIPEDVLRRIFDPFFTTKPAGSGTGLGLSVVRNIVEWHGGHVDIRNRTEGGVKVTLIFHPETCDPHEHQETHPHRR